MSHDERNGPMEFRALPPLPYSTPPAPWRVSRTYRDNQERRCTEVVCTCQSTNAEHYAQTIAAALNCQAISQGDGDPRPLDDG